MLNFKKKLTIVVPVAVWLKPLIIRICVTWRSVPLAHSGVVFVKVKVDDDSGFSSLIFGCSDDEELVAVVGWFDYNVCDLVKKLEM